MTKTQGFTALAAAATIALGWAGTASAETSAPGSQDAVRSVGVSPAPVAVKTKAAVKDPKIASPMSENGKRNVASSTARAGAADPYAVPLFKDARQLR